MCAVISTGTAYTFTRSLPKVYQARTTLLVGRTFQDLNPSTNELYLSYQLATEYASIAIRQPIQDATKSVLGLAILPKYEARARGAFLELLVTDTDPALAKTVANELARQLILLTPTSAQSVSQVDQTFVKKQLTDLQNMITEIQQQINTKQTQLTTLTSAIEIASAQAELKSLANRLDDARGTYAALYSRSQESAFNTVSVLEPAMLPTLPIGPNVLLILIMSALSGAVITTGAAYLLELLDDTVKDADAISETFDSPVIAQIPKIARSNGKVYVTDNPLSQIADEFRTLRTNLEFASVNHPLKKLVITSVEASSGKTTIATNLATVLALAEKEIILVDCDMRSPSVHKTFGQKKSPGLSELFLGHVELAETLIPIENFPNLSILPSGEMPFNPAELLGSKKMDQILDELAQKADIVILDAPPAFIVDSLVLTGKADGVLVVVTYGQTHIRGLKTFFEQLNRTGTKITGMVLNRVPKGSQRYGGYYKKYKYGQQPKIEKPVKEKGQEKPSVTSEDGRKAGLLDIHGIWTAISGGFGEFALGLTGLVKKVPLFRSHTDDEYEDDDGYYLRRAQEKREDPNLDVPTTPIQRVAAGIQTPSKPKRTPKPRASKNSKGEYKDFLDNLAKEKPDGRSMNVPTSPAQRRTLDNKPDSGRRK